MSITSRILLIAEKENIRITTLEKKIGASKGVLSRAAKNGTDIQSKWVSTIIENYPQYNAYWLLTGKGKMRLSKSTTTKTFFAESAFNESDVIKLLRDKVALLEEQKAMQQKEIVRLEKELYRLEVEIEHFKASLDL